MPPPRACWQHAVTRRRSDRLSEADAALWARVAATVQPLPGRSAPPVPPSVPRPAEPRATAIEPPRRKTMSVAAPPLQPIAHASLDGGWDRKLISGKLSPDRTIDLHGHTRDEAHDLLRFAVPDAFATGARVLLVITGRGGTARSGIDSMHGQRSRGVIRASLHHWLDTPDLRAFVAAVRPAHPRHGGHGAFYVILRRKRFG